LNSRGVELWWHAQRWRRIADLALHAKGLSYTEFLVLLAAYLLEREHGDAVSQQEVVERLRLPKMTVSDAMRALDDLGCVNRGPEFESPAFRVFVTPKGRRLLRASMVSFEAVTEHAPAISQKRVLGPT